MAKNSKTLNIDKEYLKWCRKIARINNEAELIAHFRKHVYQHYNRHKDEGKLGLKIWLIGVFNFMNILKEKYPRITKNDMLFKLCSYYKDHKKGCKPTFDIDKFMKKQRGKIKKYYYEFQAK